MKVLVTGGAGFIGSNLALELERIGHEVVIADNFNSGNKDNLVDFKGKLVEWDVSKEIKNDEKFDVIFHQGAINDPRHDNDEETYSNIIQGFKNMLDLALKNNAKFIYASTAALYGNGHCPMKEDQEKDIFTTYAKAKLEIDDTIAVKYLDKMHTVGLRYFNVFGPREGHKGRAASMIFHLRKHMLEGKNPRLFKYGEHTRDHIYVKDIVKAILLAIDARSGIYNVGTGIASSFNDVANTLNEVLGTDLKIEYFDMPFDKSTYQANSQADTTRAESVLGFKSDYTLKEGIKNYHEFLLEKGE